MKKSIAYKNNILFLIILAFIITSISFTFALFVVKPSNTVPNISIQNIAGEQACVVFVENEYQLKTWMRDDKYNSSNSVSLGYSRIFINLTKDVTLTGDLVIDRDISFNLCGYTLNLSTYDFIITHNYFANLIIKLGSRTNGDTTTNGNITSATTDGGQLKIYAPNALLDVEEVLALDELNGTNIVNIITSKTSLELASDIMFEAFNRINGTYTYNSSLKPTFYTDIPLLFSYKNYKNISLAWTSETYTSDSVPLTLAPITYTLNGGATQTLTTETYVIDSASLNPANMLSSLPTLIYNSGNINAGFLNNTELLFTADTYDVILTFAITITNNDVDEVYVFKKAIKVIRSQETLKRNSALTELNQFLLDNELIENEIINEQTVFTIYGVTSLPIKHPYFNVDYSFSAGTVDGGIFTPLTEQSSIIGSSTNIDNIIQYYLYTSQDRLQFTLRAYSYTTGQINDNTIYRDFVFDYINQQNTTVSAQLIRDLPTLVVTSNDQEPIALLNNLEFAQNGIASVNYTMCYFDEMNPDAYNNHYFTNKSVVSSTGTDIVLECSNHYSVVNTSSRDYFAIKTSELGGLGIPQSSYSDSNGEYGWGNDYKNFYVKVEITYVKSYPRTTTNYIEIHLMQSSGDGGGAGGTTYYLASFNDLSEMFMMQTFGGRTYLTFEMPNIVNGIVFVKYFIETPLPAGLTINRGNTVTIFTIDKSQLHIMYDTFKVYFKFSLVNPSTSGFSWDNEPLFGCTRNQDSGLDEGSPQFCSITLLGVVLNENTEYGIASTVLYNSLLLQYNESDLYYGMTPTAEDRILTIEELNAVKQRFILNCADTNSDGIWEVATTTLKENNTNISTLKGLRYLQYTTELILDNTLLPTSAENCFPFISQLTYMQKLSMKDCGLSVSNLGDLSTLYSVTHLYLNNTDNITTNDNNLSSPSLVLSTKLPLSVSYLNISNTYLTNLNLIKNITSLKTLDISSKIAVYSAIASTSINQIARFRELLDLPNIESVYLYGNLVYHNNSNEYVDEEGVLTTYKWGSLGVYNTSFWILLNTLGINIYLDDVTEANEYVSFEINKDYKPFNSATGSYIANTYSHINNDLVRTFGLALESITYYNYGTNAISFPIFCDVGSTSTKYLINWTLFNENGTETPIVDWLTLTSGGTKVPSNLALSLAQQYNYAYPTSGLTSGTHTYILLAEIIYVENNVYYHTGIFRYLPYDVVVA